MDAGTKASVYQKKPKGDHADLTLRPSGIISQHCNPQFLFLKRRLLKCGTKLPTEILRKIQYNTTLLSSVNTLIARGMFCVGVSRSHHLQIKNYKTQLNKIANQKL